MIVICSARYSLPGAADRALRRDGDVTAFSLCRRIWVNIIITPNNIQLMTLGVGVEVRDNVPAWQAELIAPGICKRCTGHDSGTPTTRFGVI